MSELKHDKWTGTTYGNGIMHRWLISFLKVTDVRILYAFAAIFVIPPVFVINRKARNSIFRFYRNGFGYHRTKALRMTYLNLCSFSRAIIDRFAMYAGKKFRIRIEGYEKFERLASLPEGFVQFSSHSGNYEIAGYSLKADRKRFNAIVFGGEKDSVMANRIRLFNESNIRMIPMKEDMSHLFTMNKALADGETLSMAADRVFGSQKRFGIEFLGKEAQFPQGPFLTAAIRNAEMLFVSVMKTGSLEYLITVDNIERREGKTREKGEEYARQYVRLLEEKVREYPEQWYNYFDFWEND